MQVEVKRESGEVVLNVTIPAQKVKEAFAEVKEGALKEVSVPGFRKGKAPRKIAEKHLSEDSLAEALFNRLIPPTYAEALKKEGVKPIIPPQLKILSYQKDADLVFEAKTAERPEIKLKDYKAALKKLKGKVIYGPDGKPLFAKGESASGGKGGTKITAGQVLEKLRETVDLKIPPVLIEQEVQRMFSSLIDQTQKLGITIDQYLASQGKTVDRLRKEYRETAEINLKDEFILSEIAAKEKIEVTPKEIEEAIEAAPDEKTKEIFGQDRGRAYIEDVLRKRKTIEYLLRVAEGGKQ